MQFLLVAVATPIAVWMIDRWLCRGDFSAMVRGAVLEERGRRTKTAKRRRVTT